MNMPSVLRQVAGWFCILGAASVLTFVVYGLRGQPGPVGLNGLWAEPWFLITLADLYLGVFMAIGFLWTRPGTFLKKMGWSAMFIVGGHPGVAIWLGVQLLKDKGRI